MSYMLHVYRVMSMRSLGCYLRGSIIKWLYLRTWHEPSTGNALAGARTPRHVKDLLCKPCLLPLPTPAPDAAEQLPFIMITRILRSLPLALTALACLASGAQAADDAKNDYGTVIGIGTRYHSLTALNSSSSHYPLRLQT